MKNNGLKQELANIMANMEIEMPDAILPDPCNVTHYIFEQDRKVFIDFDIGPDVLEISKMIMRWNMEDKGKPKEERKPITVYVYSYGGDMDCMWSIIDTIMASDTPVRTVNLGIAASAAGLIFLAGHERYMMPRAKIVIHEGSASIAGDAVKVMDESDGYKLSLAQMKDFIIERTEIDKKALNKKRYNDWSLDAKFCLEKKVCHKIVSSLDEIV